MSGLEQYEEITRLRAEVAKLSEWKTAVIDALVVWHIISEAHENDPKKALHDLISLEVQVALDPSVSSDAEALVERGREEMRAQIAAHERKCAGKWVKVTERLPDAHNEVAIIDSHGVASGFVDSRGGWRYVKTPVYATPTHWLDARMPGEER